MERSKAQHAAGDTLQELVEREKLQAAPQVGARAGALPRLQGAPQRATPLPPPLEAAARAAPCLQEDHVPPHGDPVLEAKHQQGEGGGLMSKAGHALAGAAHALAGAGGPSGGEGERAAGPRICAASSPRLNQVAGCSLPLPPQARRRWRTWWRARSRWRTRRRGAPGAS
jgi:hypothetical protein